MQKIAFKMWEQSRTVTSHVGLRTCEALCGRPAYIKVALDTFKHNYELHKQILQRNGCNKTGICIGACRSIVMRFCQPLRMGAGLFFPKNKLKQGLSCYIWLERSSCME